MVSTGYVAEYGVSVEGLNFLAIVHNISGGAGHATRRFLVCHTLFEELSLLLLEV